MHELLRAEVEYADAMTLLRYLETRGGTEPLTVIEALEAICRKQGASINTFDEAHIHRVAKRLTLAGIPVAIGKPVPQVNLVAAYAALDRLPMVPVFRLIDRKTDSPAH